ncbi:MAG: 1-phosphofructokinase [Chloroflexi bacterium]|jgi:1-phosphofructokinase family hexose kinase|nr:1-phosphofructokinase [Chloroflexota bacterium]
MNNIYTLTLNPAVDRELTVPAIEFDSVLRASDWQVDFGGKGFNVSRMLKSLGTASAALGFAGGKSGELLKDGLEALGIGTDFVWVDGETRTNVSIVTEAHDRFVKVNEPGPTISAAEQLSLIEKVRQLSQPDDWWVLAGSLPPGIASDFYTHLIEIIQGAGARALLDTSGEALSQGCMVGPFLVKPNDVEIQKITGLPVENQTQIVEAALVLQEMSVSNVVVSLGKQGALLVTPDGHWLVKSPPIEERNPIGAGDSLVGGLVWGLSQGMPVVEALRWGAACGAAAASLSGTAVGSPSLVKQLVALAEVHQI